MTGMFDWITFEKGKARFCGKERGVDEAGHDVFAVQAEGQATYYGEFDLSFASDHNHFSVEIVSFGYGDPDNIANTNATARAAFNPSEVAAAKSVITDLIFSYRARAVPIPHMSHFIGEVHFRDGWIRES
jgi:hypothetical protein